MMSCPYCGTTKVFNFECWGHQRTEMNVRCLSCKNEWIEVFKNVKPELDSTVPPLSKR